MGPVAVKPVIARCGRFFNERHLLNADAQRDIMLNRIIALLMLSNRETRAGRALVVWLGNFNRSLNPALLPTFRPGVALATIRSSCGQRDAPRQAELLTAR